MLQTITQKALFYLLVAALFTPLLVTETTLFPFITGKAIFFRLIVDIGIILALVGVIRGDFTRPRMNLALIGYTIFISILTLADLFGVNPLKSIWSNFERMEGLVAHLHLFGFFILLLISIRTKELWYRFLSLSLIPNAFIMVHAALQYFGFADIHQSNNRLDASLGNAAYFAIYCLWYVAIALLVFFRAEKGSMVRYASLALAFLNVLGILLSLTRGTFLGLVAGGILAAFFFVFFGKEHPKLRMIGMSVIGVVVVSTGLLIGFRDTSFVKNTEALNRFASISLTEGTAESRFMVWSMSFEGFKENPLLGWGQENFLYVFAQHYDPGMHSEEPWFDRSHNVFFDWLIAAGILGLFSYLSLFAIALYYLWIHQGRIRFSFLERVILTSALGGYFIHNVFVFDNLVSYILFFIFFAFITSVVNETGDDAKIPGSSSSDGRDAFAIAIILIGLVVTYMITLRPYFAAQNLIIGMNAVEVAVQTDPRLITLGSEQVFGKALSRDEVFAEAKKHFEKAIYGSSISRTEAREQLAQRTLQITRAKDVSDEKKMEWAQFALSELEEEFKKDKTNVRLLGIIGGFLNQTQNPNVALGFLEKALELAPNRQQTIFEVATTYTQKKDFEKAAALYKRAYDLAPEYVIAEAYYILALYRIGDNKAAEGLLVGHYERQKKEGIDIDLTSEIEAAKFDYELSLLDEAIRTNNYGAITNISRRLIQMKPEVRDALADYIEARRGELQAQ